MIRDFTAKSCPVNEQCDFGVFTFFPFKSRNARDMKGGLAAFAVRLFVVLICALASHQRESSTRQGSALCV